MTLINLKTFCYFANPKELT